MGYKHTSELNKDGDLRTRWYIANFKKCLEAVEFVAQKKNMNILNVDENYGEILLENMKFDCTITIIEITPRESSVDFSLGYRGLLDLGKSKKEIISWYNELEKRLTVKIKR